MDKAYCLERLLFKILGIEIGKEMVCCGDGLTIFHDSYAGILGGYGKCTGKVKDLPIIFT